MPLWERQWSVLREAGARRIYLSARPEQVWAQSARGKPGFSGLLHDALPNCGPLVGITAALERANGAHVIVLAVDLPRLQGEWFADLMTKCAPSVGVVGRRGGYYEPLAAIYPREMMWLAWEALGRGEYALQRWIASGVEHGLLRVVDIADAQAEWFENWNEKPGS